MPVPSPRRAWPRGLSTAALALLLPAAAGAADAAHQLRRLDQALARAESGEGRAALGVALAHLQAEDRRRQAEFAEAARRGLPPRALERLARTRQAYARGQGRLLELLRELVASDSAETPLPPEGARTLVREARAIVLQLEQASRREPISAGELKLRAPPLAAPALASPDHTAALPASEDAGGEALAAVAAAAVPEELRLAAAALEGPIDVYESVRNSIRPEFYYGAMKGALQAFREGGANDADTAAVVVQLMRARGIPARFVRGTVEAPASAWRALTGAESVEQALRVLERAGVPHQPILGAGGVVAVRMERVWAEAYLPYANYRGALLDAQGKVWVSLDAAWKPLEPPSGLDVVAELGFAPRSTLDEYLASSREPTPLPFARAKVTELLAEQRPDLSYAQVLNRRQHLEQVLGLLPSSLPYRVVARHEVAYELGPALRHTLRVLAESPAGPLLDHTVPLSDVLGGRLTLSYLPFTEEDRAVVARYGGIHLTPPYLFDVTPVLKSRGVPLAMGGAGVGMAVRYTLTLELTTPGGAVSVRNRALAGNLTAIGLHGAAASGAQPPGDTAAAILDGLARDYFRRWNDSDEELANLLRVVPLRPTASLCLAMSDMGVQYAGGDPSYPLDFVWEGILVDADLRASAPVGLQRRDSERSFLLLSGLEGSVLEDRVFSEGLQIPAVSTARALGLARERGLTVHDLTADNVDDVLPGLPLDAGVKEEIREAALRGHLARVPAAELTERAWTGVGYLLLDEDTGESAWQLQGGHSGGVTAPSAIEIPAEIRDPLAAQGEEPPPPGTEAARIEKFVSTDFQSGLVNTPLERPFKVLVTDEDGQAIARAPVTFRVIGGGGLLMDPVTREEKEEVTVLSDARGEAAVALRLGKKTDLIPRYVQLEGDEHATQVGLNVVSAFSGAAAIPEPFLAWGYPDDQFDGTDRHATLTDRSTIHYYGPLGAGSPLLIGADDPYGNPLSNIPVRLAFVPPVTQWPPPPGWTHRRGPTTTPAHVVKLAAFLACQAATPSVLWGECPGEAESLVVRSSVYGVFAYPLLGDSMGSNYAFEVGIAGKPPELKVVYPTWSVGCREGSACTRAFDTVVYASRFVQSNALGNAVEAYPPTGSGDVSYSTDSLYEEETVLREVRPDGSVHFRALGANRWRRKRLTDSEVKLRPVTPGTAVQPPTAPHVGGGRYSAQMTMGPLPQLNSVEAELRAFPFVIPYLPGGDYVDPAYVTDGNPPTVTRVQEPDRPRVATSRFSLWGAEPALTGLDPNPVLLGQGATVARESKVLDRILPAEYAALLDPRDVFFEVRTGEQRVLSAAGTDALGFRIPTGTALPAADYKAYLTIFGTDATPGSKIVSDALPVPACHLLDLQTEQVTMVLTVDPDNQVTCGDEGRVTFLVCRDSRVTLRVDGQVVTAPVDGGPAVQVRDLPLAAGLHVVELPAGLIGHGNSAQAPLLLDAVALDDPTLTHQEKGRVVNDQRNRSVTPVGRTFVKGVDLLDGHVVRQSTDLAVPGRHLGLTAGRTYSSSGASAEGAVGAGWSWTYGAGLYLSSCGLVTVTTPDGSPQVFRTSDNGATYTPQKGYHSRLVRNADLSYDFFDKAGNRHHFAQPEDPLSPEGPRRLEYVEEPHGDRIALTYAEGRVVKVEEVHPESGPVRALEVAYTQAGGFHRIARLSLPVLALRVDYEYDRFGNLVRATRSGANVDGQPASPPRVESYEYSVTDTLDRHQLLAAVDPNGSRVEYGYLRPSDTFLGEGQAVLLHDKREYAKEAREILAGAPLVTRFAYDYTEATALKWKNTVFDGRGHPTLYVMNGKGSPLEIREPLGKVTRQEWNASVLKTKETDALGRVTDYGYDARGNLASERIATTDLGVVETRYEYDPRFNKLVFKRDAEGRETRYQVDAATGDLLSTTDAVGNVTTYTYDARGRMESERSPRGHVTQYGEHDSYGHPTRITDPLGNVGSRSYDARGRLRAESDGRGHESQTVWDGLDRPVSRRRVAGGPEGNRDEVTLTGYYPAGQVRSETGPNGATTTFTLDGLNRVVATSTVVGGDTYTTASTYDANGNPVTETDRRGLTRRHTYDALNRRVRTEIVGGLAGEGPTGVVATYGYDLVGNRTFETDVASLRTDYEYDGLYRVRTRLLPQTMPEGLTPAGRLAERFTHDKAGNRLSARDPNGQLTRFEYDGLNRLVRTTNALGQVRTVRYDDPEGSHVNRSEEHDATAGLRTRSLYDALNRETERQVALEGEDGDPAPGPVYTTTTAYDDVAHALTVTDPRGTQSRVALDGLDREVERAVDPSGLNLVTRTVYDGLGNRAEVTDPEGHVTRFEHDGLGRLVSNTDAAGRQTLATYDGGNLKTSETDRRGVRRDFTYDTLGRPRRTTLAPSISGVPWSQETRYLDRDRKRIETDARGSLTTLELDGLNRVVKLTDPLGNVALTRWDGLNKREETDKRGNTTRFEYDALNRLVKTTDPAPFQGQTAETTYEDASNRTVEKDRRGILTTTQRDALGRVVSVSRAGIVVERHTYDGNGNRLSSRDAEGKETRFAYDPANRLASRTDGYGTADQATIAYAYDRDGNQTEERDQRAADLGAPFSRQRGFDALHRLVAEKDGEGHTTEYGYDAEGNRTLAQQPDGQQTEYEYEELGKLTAVTQAAPEAGQPRPVTRYQYDPARNLVKQTDANGHVVEMTYDPLHRLLTRTQDPGGLSLLTRHQYDASGNPTELIDPKGQRVVSAYDELDRLKTKTYAFAPGDPFRPWRHTTAVEYTYDPNDNITEVRESVASGNDPPAVQLTTRTWDDFNRLLAETSPLPDGGSKTVSSTYFLNGARKSITDPSGALTAYTYDAQNRLASATTQAGTPEARTTTYTYWPDGLLRTVGSPNGVVATHAYDKADRLVTLENTKDPAVVSAFAYTYDANGNRLSQIETNGGTTETTTYTYDRLDRLQTVAYPADAAFPAGRVVSYAYDAAGNRTAETVRKPDGVLLADQRGVFDNANRLTALSDLLDPAQSTAFTYDPNGNQTSKTRAGVTTSYRYDIRDRLVEAQQGSSITGRFQYDFDGRRTKKIGQDGIRQYVYDQTSLLTEHTEAGTQLAKYDYGSDRLLSLTRTDEGRRYFSLDALRSVVNLTDDAGTVVASYHLDAWGNFRFPGELAASKNRFSFTGYLWDQETDLYFAKARFYDPLIGRFTTQDSYLGQIDDPPSLHRYFYANARPTFFTDPTGHKVQQVGADPTRITTDEEGRVYVGAVMAVETEVVEVTAYPSRGAAVAADLDVTLAQPVKRLEVRAAGGVRAIGGGVQVVAGGAAFAAPEPTMVSKVGGAVLIAHGADDVQAGLRQAATGEVKETLTGTAIRKTAEKAGASPEAAAWISAGGEAMVVLSAGLALPRPPAQATTLGRITPDLSEAPASTGPVVFRPPPNATPQQVAQARAYCEGCQSALEAGELSSTGRVSTSGTLRREATRAGIVEKARAQQAGTPYRGHPGHVPDTTWTGKPEPSAWLDLDPAVNMSLGSQARQYPVGYKPTKFVFEDPLQSSVTPKRQ